MRWASRPLGTTRTGPLVPPRKRGPSKAPTRHARQRSGPQADRSRPQASSGCPSGMPRLGMPGSPPYRSATTRTQTQAQSSASAIGRHACRIGSEIRLSGKAIGSAPRRWRARRAPTRQAGAPGRGDASGRDGPPDRWTDAGTARAEHAGLLECRLCRAIRVTLLLTHGRSVSRARSVANREGRRNLGAYVTVKDAPTVSLRILPWTGSFLACSSIPPVQGETDATNECQEQQCERHACRQDVRPHEEERRRRVRPALQSGVEPATHLDARGGATAPKRLVSANPVGHNAWVQDLVLLKYQQLAVQIPPRTTLSGYAP